MPVAHRLSWLAVCAVLLVGWACSFPEDESPKVLVLIQAAHTFLLRGAQLRVRARAVRVVGSDTVSVPNVVFDWTSLNSTFATVQRDTGASAIVTGVNSGTVGIVARAANFDKAGQGDLTIRVANPLEIDSVRPRIAKYGEVLRVYGIGVDSIFLTSLGGVDLIPYPFSATRNKVTGEGRVSYWVPPPAASGNLFYLGAGVFGFADSTTKVVPRDIFEPNDTIPSKINLDAGGPWPVQLPFILFANPALAFEETPRATSGADWFDFTTSDTTSDYTFFINFRSSGDTSVRTFILDSLAYKGTVPGGYFGRDSADFIGSDLIRCKGQAFKPALAPRESTVVALRGLPSRSMHVLTFFSAATPQRYGLTVIKGYSTADPRIKPDKYEPNDFCHYADFGVRRISLASPTAVFADTLTIDNPHDIDWLRIDVPGSLTTQVRFETQARPFPTEVDTSDVDLYVFTVPNSSTPTGLAPVGSDTTAGSTIDKTLILNAGPSSSYYVAIVDFAGVATRYWLCIARDPVTPICPAPPPPCGIPRARGAKRGRPRRPAAECRRHARAFPPCAARDRSPRAVRRLPDRLPVTSPSSSTFECVRCHTPLPDNSKFCFACGADQTGGSALATTSGQVHDLTTRLQRIVEGKYKLERLLGKGGMGAVFLAQDLTLDREVAIKVLPPEISQDEHVVKRFQQEAKTAAKLDHTNIIPIYRVESDGGLNYFVMKYISGTSLEDLLETKQPMSVAEIQRILWEAACALGHAHYRGVVHRDVKPANIMFDHDGKVMLTDFGISKALQQATGLTGTGMIIGTPHYMAPEQAKGQQVDGRADQYALGVVGYRMITGMLPFSGDSVHTILYKHIFEEAPRTSQVRVGIPAFLSDSIARALAKEPDQRFATMEDFATAVWPEQPVAAPRGGKAGAPTTRGRRKAGVTAESPTEAVSSVAPTTPMPAARSRGGGGGGGARPAAPAKAEPKKSKVGLLVAVAGLAVVGIGGYVVFGRGKPEPQSPPPQQVAPQGSSQQAAVPGPTTESTKVTPPSAPPRHAPAVRPPARQTPPPPVAEEASGFITVNVSGTFGEVYIDNVDVGQTPLINYKVKAGRHTIRVERVGYKTVSETVQVDPNATVRKSYPLIPEG